jgi:hypothetical protein
MLGARHNIKSGGFVALFLRDWSVLRARDKILY